MLPLGVEVLSRLEAPQLRVIGISWGRPHKGTCVISSIPCPSPKRLGLRWLGLWGPAPVQEPAQRHHTERGTLMEPLSRRTVRGFGSSVPGTRAKTHGRTLRYLTTGGHADIAWHGGRLPVAADNSGKQGCRHQILQTNSSRAHGQAHENKAGAWWIRIR